MSKKKVAGIVICAFIALGVIGNLMNPNDSSKPSGTTKQEQKQDAKQAPKQDSQEMQAYQKFVSIPMESDYDTVKNTFGVDGKMQHENDIGGFKTQAYEFKVGKTTAIMTFQNGALTSKAMDSLSFYKQNGEKITLDEFNKIQTGMTYDQVKDLFKRDGLLKSETAIAGSGTKLYSWMNSDGSNAVITFGDGAVNSKTQTGLK